MFTGIVEGVGRVEKLEKKETILSITISNSTLFNIETPGASYAINGVCLTQTKWSRGLSTFDVVPETLGKTNLGVLSLGDTVNVERAMQVGSRIEGHFVQGHVDSFGHIHELDFDKSEMVIEVPQKVQPYLIYKGSISLDGISLTIADIEDCYVRVALIPHTIQLTSLKTKVEGDPINIEVDMFAKYTYKYLGECTEERVGFL